MDINILCGIIQALNLNIVVCVITEAQFCLINFSRFLFLSMSTVKPFFLSKTGNLFKI